MTLTVRALRGPELEAALDDMARLRITVFRDWPYLYHGTLDYERNYLQTYRDSPGAMLVAAIDDGRIVGASTSAPMEDHAAEFAEPLRETGLALEKILYGAESVLLPEYRGRGVGHKFFDLREEHARALGRSHVAFCSVMRPADHPLRPESYRGNDVFWTKRGYAPLPGAIAHFTWQDVDQQQETEKPLQFWIRRL
ncbi:GNAT family N-acetyltransferase [Pseudogemmobacter humi]|uniref:Acetyltransferase (GNAT) family protein n=1 Tax=Pseudogemmobacter humi TaxID=2483812 RepID=A0A3P5WYY3_9RHOB|nr:GNAT family N-acetyltransferase [Pseudogemmobacter humi]VDC27080.1 Acetyltransferase (GNAT) family protein [Pseudogemmobacter humi]